MGICFTAVLPERREEAADIPSTTELSECQLCCEKAADVQVLPCKHVVYCHPCKESVRAIKKCLECRVSFAAKKI